MLGAVALLSSCKKNDETEAPLYQNQWIDEDGIYLSLENNGKGHYGVLLTEKTLSELRQAAAKDSDASESLKKMLDEAKPDDIAAAEITYNIILNEGGTSGALILIRVQDDKPLTMNTTFRELSKDSMIIGGEEDSDETKLQSVSSLGIQTGKNYPEIFTYFMK